jgi:hypothetical protein
MRVKKLAKKIEENLNVETSPMSASPINRLVICILLLVFTNIVTASFYMTSQEKLKQQIQRNKTLISSCYQAIEFYSR